MSVWSEWYTECQYEVNDLLTVSEQSMIYVTKALIKNVLIG
jgi:hypothetical protein